MVTDGSETEKSKSRNNQGCSSANVPGTRAQQKCHPRNKKLRKMLRKQTNYSSKEICCPVNGWKCCFQTGLLLIDCRPCWRLRWGSSLSCCIYALRRGPFSWLFVLFFRVLSPKVPLDERRKLAKFDATSSGECWCWTLCGIKMKVRNCMIWRHACTGREKGRRRWRKANGGKTILA